MPKQKVKGAVLIEMLLAASPGESILVETENWTSLDDREFEVTGDLGEGAVRFVTLYDEQDELDPEALYEARR